MAGVLLLIIVLPSSSAGWLCRPQQAQIHYHFGDDRDGRLGWADPGFDDSAWPVAENGRWPVPAASSDGFMWVRVRVPVRSDAAGPLAIRVIRLSSDTGTAISDEIFINGQSVAARGGFPPSADPIFSPTGAVVKLPDGLVQPGSTASVACRMWLPLGARWRNSWLETQFEIDANRNLLLLNHDARVTAVLAFGPYLGLNAIIAVLGLGLLILWRFAGGRELLWCSGLLLLYSIPGLCLDFYLLGLFRVPWRIWEVVFFALQAAQMAVTVEFIWTIFGLRADGLKRLAFAVRNGRYAGIELNFHFYSIFQPGSLNV
jgi:hypothetical protein